MGGGESDSETIIYITSSASSPSVTALRSGGERGGDRRRRRRAMPPAALVVDNEEQRAEAMDAGSGPARGLGALRRGGSVCGDIELLSGLPRGCVGVRPGPFGGMYIFICILSSWGGNFLCHGAIY